MRCPFIRETTVKSCRASSFRKMIVETATDPGHERCSSPDHVGCPTLSSRDSGGSISGQCRFLQETLVEYCSAAAVPKYIPATEGLLPRCNSERHRYCDLFLAGADPLGERLAGPAPASTTTTPGLAAPVVEGVVVPAHLSYTTNHMWLDVASDGFCHVGVDGFLARVVGTVERVTFVAAKPIDRPIALLTVNGVDLQLAFPNQLEAIVPNTYLRTNPPKIAADPYGAGWLFEGVQTTHAWLPGGAESPASLIPGDAALPWFRAESDRLAAFVHERIARPGPDGRRLMADGGRVESGLAAHLGRDDLINLFNEFFPAHVGWRRPW